MIFPDFLSKILPNPVYSSVAEDLDRWFLPPLTKLDKRRAAGPDRPKWVKSKS